METKIIALLGLAQRASKLSLGDSQSTHMINKGKAKLVIIAEDAGGSTKSKFIRLCELNNIPCIIISNKISLGKAIGRDEKAVIAVLDNGFSVGIMDAHTKK